MQTITIKFLTAQVDRLNLAMSLPLVPYIREGDKLTAQIGNYHLSGAYGGHALHKMANDGGGVSDVFGCGHVPKRDLSARISAMIAGIDAAHVAAEKPMTTTTDTTAAKPKNPYRIRLAETLQRHGLTIEECDDSIVPACCSEGCEVEPDGRCEHGCPSVLLAAGMI